MKVTLNRWLQMSPQVRVFIIMGSVLALFMLVMIIHVLTRRRLGVLEPLPQIKRTHIWQGQGIRFAYPGNWKHRSQPLQGEDVAITIESYGYAVALLLMYARVIPPRIMARSIYNALKPFRVGTPMNLVSAKLGKYPAIMGQFRVIPPIPTDVQLEVSILVMDRASKTGKTYALLCLVPVEDHATAQPGFDLIRQSFTISE